MSEVSRLAFPHSLPVDWLVPDLNGRGNGPYGILHLLRWRTAERFKANMKDPEGAQKCALDRVMDAARGTSFGASHDLGKGSHLSRVL